MRRFSFAITLFFILLYQSRLIPRAISICAPFFIPRLFRSFCPNSICLLLPFNCSRIVSPSSLLLLWSLVRSVLSLYLYFFTSLFALRDSHHLEYIGIAPVTELGMQRLCDAYGAVAKDRITNPIVLPFLVNCPTVSHANTRPIQRDYRQRQHVQCGD
jgi:hypothetical protein